MRRFVYSLVIISLLFSLLPTPTSALPAPIAATPLADADKTAPDILAFLAPPDSQPLLQQIPEQLAPLYDLPVELQQATGPYRTTVNIRGAADLSRLKKMGVTVLSSTKTESVVIADRSQLEQLAKTSFFPRKTELTGNLRVSGGARLSTTATATQILAATVIDTDGDGLDDTEEGWWCTDPANADSDNDKVKDGDEVNALRDWILHKTATRPASGKPFAGWPTNHTGCYDSDYDSVPDAVEVYVFGLNPNRESTARDKFDDGQKLFGLTNCPGSGSGCGYGALPRVVDWGVIFAEMPSWVKPPYDSPFVAAFPDPDIEVVPSSFVVTAKTIVQSTSTIQSGQSKTYGTTETRGTSTSRADTETWNTWDEVSVSKAQIARTATRTPLAVSSSLGKQGGFLEQVGQKLGAVITIEAQNMCPVEGVKTICRAIKGQANATRAIVGVVQNPGMFDPLGDSLYWGADVLDRLIPDEYSPKYSCDPTCDGSNVTKPSAGDFVQGQDPETQDYMVGAGGKRRSLMLSNQGTLTGFSTQAIYPASFPLLDIPVTTNTRGTSRGGAVTTTNTQYEEHATTESQQFMDSTAWATAWTTDTVHAADLSFSYRVSNKGTDYAREIGGIAFNIYVGDDPNPVYTYYPAADIGGAGTYSNFMPGETHQYVSRSVPLTLNQMKAIDTGARIYIVIEDYNYGVDELFYQDAINSGASFAVDSGDGILHSYVLPTWGTESIQDVAKRYFPVTEDGDGNLLSLTVPHYTTATPTWVNHALTDTSWWNLYLNNLGDGSAAFKDTPAAANSTVLIRMNSDTDRDGYSDRTESALGTNSSDPASHPSPQVIAATHSTRTGNTVSVNMAFLNSGNYDAYGVEAVLYAPDSTVTINDNTIGGSGRVKAASQVVLGSRIMPASTTNWRGTSKPYATGSYSGNVDKVFTFTAANPGNISQGTVNINWNDGVGNSGTVNYGSGYNAPLPGTIRDGLQIGFDTGTINAGDIFTVEVRLPRDTFSYTINQEPYTAPVVVVSYNDPQGNHKFVTPVEVSDLGTNLAPYASQMLPEAGVDVSTNAAFNPSGNNTVYLVANSPHAQSITNGYLFAEFVNDAGTVVAEQVFTQTLQSGPTVVPVTFNPASFNPAYQAGRDYTLLAFFTDSQGNIIDSHARLFSTFGQDPQPVLNTSPASWPIGTVLQGAQPQRTISIVNTGVMPLNVVVSSSDSKLTLSGANGILSVPPAGTRDVIATLDTTTISGTVSMNIAIRSNDPAHQTVNVPVSGNVTTSSATAAAFDIVNRPLDKTVRVYGSVPQFSTVDFTHGIQPDTVTVEPCKIYAADGTTLKGVGKYCADFNAGTVSAQVFGTGADGPLTVAGSQIVNNTRTALSSTSNSGQPVLNVATTSGFVVGQEILVHQTQGVNAGQYEFAKISAIGSGTFTLQTNLSNTYTQSGNSRAQAIRVPNYTDVTVQSGGALVAPAWDGSTGGMLAFRANGTVNVQGTLSASGATGPTCNSAYCQIDPATGGGFRGGRGMNTGAYPAFQGEGINGPGGTSKSANSNGGGGAGSPVSNGSPGGGGGHRTSGQPGQQSDPGSGGNPAGSGNLSIMVFGGGGGGATEDSGSSKIVGAGGNGGGTIFVAAKTLTVSGYITSNGGGGGGSNQDGGAGGGAGGSIYLMSRDASLGAGRVAASGGPGGIGAGRQAGGNGSDGWIRVDYQNIDTNWSTTPAAYSQAVAFYIADSVASVSFGTGADGPLNVTGTQTINTTRTALNSTSNAGLMTLNVASTTGFAANQEVLIHQTQGTGAGTYEFAKIAGVGSGTLSLQTNLQNTYTQGGNSRAQVIRVPHYTDVTVPGGATLTAPAWDGSTGGILVFRATGAVNVFGQITANGRGFRGGTGNGANNGYQGEGYSGPGTLLRDPNGNGGGGGFSGYDDGGGGGGGANSTNGYSGQNGSGGLNQGSAGYGGAAYGSADFSSVTLGGGGGAGGGKQGGGTMAGGTGGTGGGIIFVFSKSISLTGQISALGTNGAYSDPTFGGGGGGGAGGSILIRAQTATIGTNLVVATGGTGAPEAQSGSGGNAGTGRVRIEYQTITPGWSTDPIASSAQVQFYISESADPSTVHFTVPDNITNGQNYIMQFGRHLAFTGSGNQLTYTRVLSRSYSSVTVDALLSNLGAGGATTLSLDVGDDGSTDYSYNGSLSQPTALGVSTLTTAYNTYIQSHAAVGGYIDVPVRVTINRQADVMLTNMALTPGAGLDLAVSSPDLVVGCPGAPGCLATEGYTPIPITVTLHNTGNQNASSAVVGYYAGNPQAGGRLLGNSYVATIPAGGTATANFNWSTEGFRGNQTLYAFVDPPNAIAETLENNNIVSQTVYIKTKPDLRVGSISLDRTDRIAGEPIVATIVISNTGETDSLAHTTLISATGQLGDGSAGPLPTSIVTATNAVTLSTSFTPSLFGAHVITVTADSGGGVTESNETNNVLTRTVYVGLPAQNIDAGGAGDSAYDASNGYGYLNGLTYDFGGGTITKTVRYDGNGALQYRFDGLQPARSYHLDATFYQEGETFTQKTLFDGIDLGKTTSLVSGTLSTASILVPAAAYTDTRMVVTFQRPSGSTSSSSRFKGPNSSIGPAFVSQVSLVPIEYIYVDAGSSSELPYDAARGFGYIGNNTFASSLGGSDALNSYRTAFGNTLYYQFNNLNAAKNYLLDLTMYDGSSSARVQSVTMDSNPVAGCTGLPVNSAQRVQCPIDPARYTGDGIVIVGVVCDGCSGPRVNEIALEEKTREVIDSSTSVPPSPTPTGTNVSSFAALWSGSQVQVTWATTSENQTSKFELYRTNSLDPAAWTLVRTQASQSNCAASGTPFSYGYTDTGVVSGQTYYYKLTWSGDSCGGSGGVHAQLATASPVVTVSIPQSAGWNLVSLPISPTQSLTAERVAGAINAQGGNCTEVYRWVDGWDSHIVGLPFNDFAVGPDTGFFLKCAKAGTWSLQGSPLTQARPITLNAGWNLIALSYLPSPLTAESLGDGINAQGGSCTEVNRWTDGWDPHINGLPFNDFNIELGKAYFIKCAQASTYVPGGGATGASMRTSSLKGAVVASRRPTVSQVQVTNVRDTTITLSWVTDSPAQGWVNYGTSVALGSTAYDGRGVSTVSATHYVVLRALQPNTTYYIDLVSDGTVDNNGGSHYRVTTGPTLGLSSPDPAYGQVFRQGLANPAEGALVYATVNDQNHSGSTGSSARLAGLVDQNGYWHVNLGNARLDSLTNYFVYSPNGDALSISVNAGPNGTAGRVVDTSASKPVIPISLQQMFGLYLPLMGGSPLNDIKIHLPFVSGGGR